MLTIIVILIAIFAFVVGFMMARKHFEHREHLDFIEIEAIEKAMRLEKIIDFLEENEEIKNDDVEELLGVSDATATRYLEDLEEMGRIRQIGERGRYVHYELI